MTPPHTMTMPLVVRPIHPQGILNSLSYFQDLGVDALWISPMNAQTGVVWN